MASLYDHEVDLSTGDNGIPASKAKDRMRVRLVGARRARAVNIPVMVAEIMFVNDCDAEVTLKRGAAVPTKVSAGTILTVLVGDGPNDMRVVR